MTGEHAEIAFGARNIDLIDVAGERDLLRRDEFKMEGGHALSAFSAVTRGLDPRVHRKSRSSCD